MPVVKCANDAQIIAATLMKSYLWDYVKIYELKTNVRASLRGANVEIKHWSEYLLNVGDGKERTYPQFGHNVIKLPSKIVSKSTNLLDFTEEVFDDFENNYKNREYIQNRCIMTPKNDEVDEINNIMLDKIPEPEPKPYTSFDCVPDDPDFKYYDPEYLHGLNVSGMPKHSLRIKKYAPIMIMRNIDQRGGVCNGTKLIVDNVRENSILATIITGTHIGRQIFIPRITFLSKEEDFGFVFKRKQFPVRLCFALTINKVQGQTCSKAGIFLPEPVFSHGQLYVALSRVGSPNDIKVFVVEGDRQGKLNGDDGVYTVNEVYDEVMQMVQEAQNR